MPVPAAITPDGAADNTDTQNTLPDDSEVKQPGEYDFGPPGDGDATTPPSAGKTSADVSSGAGSYGEPTQVANAPDEQVRGAEASKDQSLAERARYYGVTDAEMESMTPEQLSMVMGIQDRQIAALGRAAMEQQQQWQQQPAQTPQEQDPAESEQTPFSEHTPEEQSPEVPQQGGAVAKYDLGIGDDWEDDVANVFHGLNDHYHSELERMSNRISDMTGDLHGLTGGQDQQAAQQYEEEMDTFFDSLGDEWSGVFGRGPVRGLTEGSQELEARRELNQELGALIAGDMQVGRPSQTIGELAERSLWSAFRDKALQIEKGMIGKQVAGRRRQGISRPSSRNATSSDGRERAMQRANEFYRERGMEPSPRAPVDI
jgi:hypothetical protein